MEHLDIQRIKKKIRKINKNVDFLEKRDFLTSYDKQGNYIVEDYANNNPDFFVVITAVPAEPVKPVINSLVL